MRRFLADPALREQASANALTLFRDEFSMHEIIEQLLRAYRLENASA